MPPRASEQSLLPSLLLSEAHELCPRLGRVIQVGNMYINILPCLTGLVRVPSVDCRMICRMICADSLQQNFEVYLQTGLRLGRVIW